MHFEPNQACPREASFDYKPPRTQIRGWSWFFGTSAVIFGFEFFTNEQGLRLNGWEMTPFAATIFYGLVASVCLFGLAAGVWLSFRSTRVVFAGDALLMPKSWWSVKQHPVLYRDLRAIRMALRRSALTGGRLLYIRHNRGLDCLSEAMFPAIGAFDDCLELLTQKLEEQEGPDAVR